MEFSSPTPGAEFQIRTELKDVSILIADIENSTRLIEDMDPERASAALDPIIGIMVETVHEYGGTVASIAGDGILAIFGAPVSLEGHAVQACFSGLEITEKVKKRSLEADDKINVRVGIDSGKVLVRTYTTGVSTSFDAVGLPAHLASKIEKLAPSNTVALSQNTERQAREFITAEPIGKVTLEHSQYDVLHLTGRANLVKSTSRKCRKLCGIINHHECFDRLQNATLQLSQGQGCSILLEGDPGVGKSRILSELVSQFREGSYAVLRIEGVLHNNHTLFQPFRELLVEQLKIDNQESQQEIDGKLNKLLARHNISNKDCMLALRSLFTTAIADRKWEAANPDWRREATIDAIVSLLTSMANEIPVVFIAEDLHWMDQGSMAIISRLAQLASSSRILFLVTQRPEHTPALLPHHEVDQFIRMDRLGPKDTLSMCVALLGDDAELRSLARQLVQQTEGVPLFLEELVLNLREAGAIQGELGQMSVGASPAEINSIQLPSSITSILASRIDRLRKPAHQLLQLACVIGNRFRSALLQTASGLSDEEFQSILTTLMETRLIFESGEITGEQYSFSHALARDVCYGSMISSVRRQRHATIANAMRNYYGSRIHEYTEELAHHLTEAGAYEDAIEQWQEASRRALLGAGNLEALDALETAISLLDKLPKNILNLKKKLELKSLLGSVLITARGPGHHEVESVYAECRDLAEELGESQEMFRSLWGQWRIAWRVPNKLAIARQLSELAEQNGEVEFIIQSHHAQWAANYNGGNIKTCLKHISCGLEHYEERLHGQLLLHYGGHDAAVCGYGEAALCHWILGDPDTGAKMARGSLEHAKRLNHAGSIGHGLDYALFFLQHTNNPNETLRLAKEAISFAEDKGLPHYEARARAWRGWAVSQLDDINDGIDQMAAAVDQQRLTGVEEDFPVFLEVLAGLETSVGRQDRALSYCLEALELAQKSGMRHWLAEIKRREGVVRSKLGGDQRDQALDALHAGLGIAIQQGARAIEARIRNDLSRLDVNNQNLP